MLRLVNEISTYSENYFSATCAHGRRCGGIEDEMVLQRHEIHDSGSIYGCIPALSFLKSSFSKFHRLLFWIRGTLGVSLLGLSSCALTDRGGSSQYETRVAMRVDGNLPFVNVSIAGKSRDFLVDSGASDCVISPEMASELGLSVSREKAMVKSAAGDRVPIPMALLPSMQIGKAEFHNVPVFVYDLNSIRGHFPGLEGVVGFSIFRDATVTFDYPGKSLTITPGPTLQSKDPSCVPMTTRTGVPRIPLRGRGHEVPLDVDTGSTGGIEINPGKLGMRTNAPTQPGGLSASIGQSYRTGVTRVVGSLYLGSVEIADPIVEVTNGDFRVGGEVLQNTILSLDQPAKLARVSFGKTSLLPFLNKPRKLVSPSRIGTGIGFGRGWVVVDVVPDSPAHQAGVKVGDLCVSVEGRSTEGLADSYQQLLQSKHALSYRFQRGSTTFDAVLPVMLQVR